MHKMIRKGGVSYDYVTGAGCSADSGYKLYDSNDMVKADSHNCEGCCDCSYCRNVRNLNLFVVNRFYI